MAFDIETFHRRAVQTPSHEQVDSMRTLLVNTLEAHGLETRIDEVGNVLASRGSEAPPTGAHVLLNTHIDTVPPHLPYERRLEPPGSTDTVDGTADVGTDDIICGRGACDAKGPLAALLDAFLRTEVTDGRLTLGISIDEETTQIGGSHLAETVDADSYIVGEPTGLDICTAARGQFEGTITIRGKSAHVANPDRGQNAIGASAVVLEAIERYDHQRGPPVHKHLGAPLLAATMIDGGEATNQIPETCTITFDRRSVPPETTDDFCDAFETHLETALPDGFTLEVALIRPDTPFPEAFATDRNAPVVTHLQAASGGAVRPFEAATEASYFAQKGPTVVFGPGELSDDVGAVAHSRREYVHLPAVFEAARALRQTLERLV